MADLDEPTKPTRTPGSSTRGRGERAAAVRHPARGVPDQLQRPGEQGGQVGRRDGHDLQGAIPAMRAISGYEPPPPPDGAGDPPGGPASPMTPTAPGTGGGTAVAVAVAAAAVAAATELAATAAAETAAAETAAAATAAAATAATALAATERRRRNWQRRCWQRRHHDRRWRHPVRSRRRLRHDPRRDRRRSQRRCQRRCGRRRSQRRLGRRRHGGGRRRRPGRWNGRWPARRRHAARRLLDQRGRCGQAHRQQHAERLQQRARQVRSRLGPRRRCRFDVHPRRRGRGPKRGSSPRRHAGPVGSRRSHRSRGHGGQPWHGRCSPGWWPRHGRRRRRRAGRRQGQGQGQARSGLGRRDGVRAGLGRRRGRRVGRPGLTALSGASVRRPPSSSAGTSRRAGRGPMAPGRG